MGSPLLLCLPHAGGVASAYRGWAGRFPGWTVQAATYPGREARFREPLVRTVAGLVASVAPLVPFNAHIALFGHSLGALVAFELARRLTTAGRPPLALIVAGQRSPHRRKKRDLHALPDQGLLDELRRMGGMEADIEASRELLDLVLPRIRADIEAAESYEGSTTPRLTCPVLALTGSQDADVDLLEARAWSSVTDGRFAAMVVAGSHFFVRENVDAVTGALRRFLDEVAPADP